MQVSEKSEKMVKVLHYYNLIDDVGLMEKFKIVCPFHGDVNASLQINLDTGTFYCYGCGKSGDYKDFVKNIEGTDDLHTLIKIESILKSNKRSNYKITEIEKQTPEELLFEAKRYFYSLPTTNWKKEKGSYMHKRGFTSDTLNLVGAKINFNDSYGVIMPMKENGKFRGYVCRATKKDVESYRKYLYNKGFTRRNTLVGNYKYDYVIVVEGYMDWLKFIQFKKYNCVAILGWKITPIQIKKLKKYAKLIISALDNTPTGRQGTKELRKHFNVVRFQFPSNVKDPGDLTQMYFNKAWLDTVYEAKKLGFNIN